MKFSSFVSTTLLASLCAAAPTPTADINERSLVKRSSVTETPTTGYATENGGTTGGSGGSTTTVSTYAQFTEAATSDGALIIVVDGTITETADQVKVTTDKTIVGKDSSAKLIGFGLLIKVKNVIVRNLTIQKVLAANGDAIGLQTSSATNIWIDHCDLSSDRDHDKDYYDGLLDITHAADFVTISNTYFHDHWKASLVGHSDNNGDEDTGYLHVTYANNYWLNVNSRAPSLRFGTGHIFNSYFSNVTDAINARDGAQVLVESNVFVDVDEALYSVDDTGEVVSNDNDFGDSPGDEAAEGTLTSVPYTYTLLGSADVEAGVVGSAGATLTF